MRQTNNQQPDSPNPPRNDIATASNTCSLTRFPLRECQQRDKEQGVPSTVSACFDAFRTASVDLPTELTATARSSRDFLYAEVASLSKEGVLQGTTLSFGSFARRTKKAPLDDIDCLAMLECKSTTSVYSSAYTYELRNDDNIFLEPYTEPSRYVNSTKVLNAVKKRLESVSQYGKSDIGRNGSAVVLNLKSYAWSFDVVPTCPVSDSNSGTAHYLIPNGSGQWTRTDPRIDAGRATTANTTHSNRFLPAVRILKYWNSRTHKPALPSYYFETLLTNRALSHATYASLQNVIEDLLYGVTSAVLSGCPDPKNLGPNLDDDVSYDTKSKVHSASVSARQSAVNAINAEIAGDHKSAIGHWRLVFGPGFPQYG